MNDYEEAYNHVSSDEETSISGGESTDGGGSPKTTHRTIDKSKLKPPPPQEKREYYDMTMNENGEVAGDEGDEEDRARLSNKAFMESKHTYREENQHGGYSTQLPKLAETSLMDKIMYEAKKRKIDQLRRFQGGLIRAQRSNNIDDINNIFVSSTNP